MRIVLVEFAGRGGLVHYAFQLARGLARQGADVTLVTDRTYELDALPAPFRVVKLLDLWDAKPAGRGATGALARAARLARRGWRALVYYREWLRLLLFLRREKPDWVQFADIRFPADAACYRLARVVCPRIADVCHNVRPFTADGRAPRRLAHALLEDAYRRFDVVFVHDETNRRLFLETYDVPAARLAVITHGNQEIFRELRDPAATPAELRARLRLGPAEPVVLLFGTLARYKGPDVLLRAFPRVLAEEPRARLVIAGFPVTGFDLPAHERLAAELGIADKVRFEPSYVESGAVAAWMELAAVTVFPYRLIYHSGAVHVPQAFGVPIVATRVGTLPDVVEDGRNGILVPPEDEAALAVAIAGLLRDPERARQLGEQGARDARERFSWDETARAILAACSAS